MPTALALHSTPKRSSKLGGAKIRVEHSLLSIILKALWGAFVHSKLLFFMHSVKGATMELKSLTN